MGLGRLGIPPRGRVGARRTAGGHRLVYLRGGRTLYEHELMRWLGEQTISYAISADMASQLAHCIATLPEMHWKAGGSEAAVVREIDGNPLRLKGRPQRGLRVHVGQTDALRNFVDDPLCT